MEQEAKYKFGMDFNKTVINTQTYYEFLKNAQELATNSPNISLLNINEGLIEKIKKTSSSRKITNLIFSNLESNSIDEKNNLSASYLSKAQRSIVEGQELKRIWNELGTNVSDMKKFRPIFTTAELLEQILSLTCSNLSDLAASSMTGLVNVPISIKSLSELKKKYERISLDFFQSGLDENLNSVIEQEKHKNGVKVIDINDSILSKEFSKTGCTKSLRAKLWSQILNVNVENLDIIYYNYLKQCVFDFDFLIDSIYYKDVKTKAVNDDQLFVFEDLLYQVLLMFARDTHLLSCYEEKSIQPPRAFIKLKNSTDLKQHSVVYPPNGFIPFDGFSMLVAPICYVYSDPVLLYFMFRKFFVNHFYKLSIISSDPQSIVGLCALFENVFQSKDPKLFFHLKKMDIQPIRIAFKWIIRAFSGYLQSSELLELWDRLLAFNSLEILPIFAVGIFLYRRQSLMSVTNKLHVESILDDLKSIKVVAILQLVFV